NLCTQTLVLALQLGEDGVRRWGRWRHEDMVAGREEANMQQSEQVRVRAPPAGRVVVIARTATWPSTLQGGTVNHHHQSDSGGDGVHDDRSYRKRPHLRWALSARDGRQDRHLPSDSESDPQRRTAGEDHGDPADRGRYRMCGQAAYGQPRR